MKIAIIGAGKMGQWFAKFFLKEGFSIIVSDRNEEALSRIKNEMEVETGDNTTALKDTDRVLICVPINNFVDVLREIRSHVRSDQVIMDICSTKEFPVKAMHKYIRNGITLGTHPMFGPTAKGIKDKNFLLTPTNARERLFAKTFKRWLEERQAKVSIMPPKMHDELMSIVLGLPHFLGAVVAETLASCANLAQTKEVAGSSYKKLLALTRAVISQDPEFYANLQMKLPKLEKIEGLFCQKSMEWLKLVQERDELAFARRMRFLKAKLTSS